MANTNMLYLSLTGVQIKALFVNPTINTVETVNVVSGLLGAGAGDVVSLYDIAIHPDTYILLTTTLVIPPFGGILEIDTSVTSPPGPRWQSSKYLGDYLGGAIPVTFEVYDTGATLSDIPDSTVVHFWINAALNVGSAPGVALDKTVASLSATVSAITLTPGATGPTGPTGVTGSTGTAGATGPTGVNAKYYAGAVQKTQPIVVTKSATVSSGTAVFHFTSDGTSTGTTLFPNGPDLNSIVPYVNDASASYQFGWVWTNSNKTLTITTNKLTTANILSGILGQTAANGSACTVTVWGS